MPLIIPLEQLKGKWRLENGLEAVLEGESGPLYWGHCMYEGRKFPLIWDQKYNEYSGVCPGFNLKNRLPNPEGGPTIRSQSLADQME